MKLKIVPVVLIAFSILSLSACTVKVETNGEKEAPTVQETTNIPETTPQETAAAPTAGQQETTAEPSKAPEETAAETTANQEETSKDDGRADYNDFINNSKSDEVSEWTEVSSLVLTDCNHAIPETEVAWGDKFLRWTLKSASIKNYGSNTFGIKAAFDGEATVIGTVEYNVDQSGEFENKIIFKPQVQYYSLFPRTALDTRGVVWFTIDDSAKGMLGIGDEPCKFKSKIVISEYNIFFAPMGVADSVKIEKAESVE